MSFRNDSTLGIFLFCVEYAHGSMCIWICKQEQTKVLFIQVIQVALIMQQRHLKWNRFINALSWMQAYFCDIPHSFDIFLQLFKDHLHVMSLLSSPIPKTSCLFTLWWAPHDFFKTIKICFSTLLYFIPDAFFYLHWSLCVPLSVRTCICWSTVWKQFHCQVINKVIIKDLHQGNLLCHYSSLNCDPCRRSA